MRINIILSSTTPTINNQPNPSPNGTTNKPPKPVNVAKFIKTSLVTALYCFGKKNKLSEIGEFFFFKVRPSDRKYLKWINFRETRIYRFRAD